ncbi:hypothetical protein [Cupriavidus pauculus]|uniref:Site-specific integrase n=1 Tax=Cupriavidus pauculus TaxID=82633 RepID=A0A3G8H038_9BURK|nr:hypothetical protein [Cupriavidus pauculus]AZG13804.1 hypothetical protein EHF44_10280 [Cupriavidus pauculus]
MVNKTVPLHPNTHNHVPKPTAENPFVQLEWIFALRQSRVPSESGQGNYRYALKFYLRFAREKYGESPFILKERWGLLAMVVFKTWLLSQENADSPQLSNHTAVGIMSAVRQVMADAVTLDLTAERDIINAPMGSAQSATDKNAPFSADELASILEAVKTDFHYTNAVLKGYVKTGLGRDPEQRPPSGTINPRDYARHGYGWNCENNLRWYFENRMACRAISSADISATAHRGFFRGCIRYFGGIFEIYKRWGVTPLNDRDILCPLFIQLSYLTGLNPYSLCGLRVDCLSEHPLTGTPVLRYLKLRSDGEKELLLDLLNNPQAKLPSDVESVEMPLKREHAILVERTVKKILQLTAPIRQQLDFPSELSSMLFVYQSSGNNCRGEYQSVPPWKANQWCRNMGERHALKNQDGERLVFTLVRFRPTRLTEMAAQGKDFFEIQHAAGHKSIRQTLAYIQKRTMDVIAEREVTNALETIWNNREEYAKQTKKTPEYAGIIFHGLMSRCKNVFDPPRAVQLAADYVPGQACTRFNMCLLCKNIVVLTPHLPILAHYRTQLRRCLDNSALDVPIVSLYEKSLAVLDQIFDPDTSEFDVEEIEWAIAASENLDFVIDPLTYPGGETA